VRVKSQSPRHLQRALIAAVAAVGLAACAAAGDEPAGLPDEPASTPPAQSTPAETAPAETPSPEPEGEGPTEHRFPEAGVTVVEPAPADDTQAAALAAYVEFAREWRWSLREVQLSEQLAGLAVSPVVQTVEDSLDYQVDNGIRYGGEMIISPVVDRSEANTVVLGGCIDGSAVLLVDDGVERIPDGVDEHPVIPMRVVLTNDGSGWKVNENTLFEDESC
jgi:hypothetical protein